MTTLTKEAIRKSFMQLLNEKPVSKITVKEIVETCGINRNSFYYHYSDIPSLMEEILNEQADMLLNVTKDMSIYECIMRAMNFALENKAAMMHIFNSANRDMLDRYLDRVANRTVNGYFDVYFRDEDVCDEDKQAIVMYYKSLLIGFVIAWMRSGMNYDLREQLQRLCELFEGSTETAVERSRKKTTC